MKENAKIEIIPLILNNSNLDKTEYFSASSEPAILNINENNILDKSFISEIELKNKQTDRDITFDEISRNDSFETYGADNFNLQNEYELMREYLRNGEYDKMRELDKKIAHKEIAKRKAENKLRMNRLRKLEEKIRNDERININKQENFDNPKPDLVLANIIKDGGYHIITEEEAKRMLESQNFCGYVFYTLKK